MACDDVVQVKVLFFASAREAAGGITETTLELESGADTAVLRCVSRFDTMLGMRHDYALRNVLQSFLFSIDRNTLAEKYSNLASLVLDEDNITLALNEEYVTGVQKLKSGDVVALIPPISGG